MTNKSKGLMFISITILCWGTLSIAIKSVSAQVSPLNIAWFRFAFAAVCLAGYHAARNPQLLKIFIKPPFLVIIAGLCLGGNYLGFTMGVALTSPSITQIIIQIGPLALALSGIFLFKEKLNRWQAIGFIIALTGFSLFYKDQLTQFLNTNDLNTGVAWTIFGALTWTCYAIIQKKMILKFPPSQLNLLIFGVPALAFLPVTNMSEFIALGLEEWLLLIFLGFNTIIAYGCLGEAFKYLPANNISILITLNPLLTLLIVDIIHALELNWIPHSPMSSLGYIGASLVITGAIMIVGMQRKRLPKAKPA